MSIWSSIGSADSLLIPGRDNYTGEPVSDAGGSIDVAIARPWHDLIRLSIDGGQFGPVSQEVLLTVAEARELIAQLTTAIERLEPPR